ncbi:MAG: hypothetical protein WC750_05415 [Patescibacteria group bacterium]|jgi:hypothetical protein
MQELAKAAVKYLASFTLIIQRHGNTDPLEPGQSDLDRKLSKLGTYQSVDAAVKRDQMGYKPTFKLASIAERCVDTVAPKPIELATVKLPELYAKMVTPEDQSVIDAAVEIFKYAPLNAYVENENVYDALERWTAIAALCVTTEVARRNLKPDDVILIGCHAVLSQALALRLIARGRFDHEQDRSVDKLLALNLDEAEQIIIEQGNLKHVL